MEFAEFKAKTVDEALMNASISLGVPSNELEYEVIEKESSGFLGLKRKPAVIKARIRNQQQQDQKFDGNTEIKKQEDLVKDNKTEETKESITVDKELEEIDKTQSNESKIKKIENVEEIISDTRNYLDELFHAMKINAEVKISFDESKNDMSIDLAGNEMGILIGKRGQTLDSLQYLISLYVNKMSDNYIRIKLDTENYRARRKETLENLARNIAHKVKKTKKAVYLEPMNPYERRIIHSALQNDKYVYTKSEGEEPYRKVVVLYKK